MNTATDVVEQICKLKRDRGNTYPGDYDEMVRVHVGRNLDHFEYIEKDGRVVAFIEWYEGRPVYDNQGVLKEVKKDPTSLYIANLVANSTVEILQMGRKLLRWVPEAKSIHWTDQRYGRKIEFKIKEQWRS